MILVKKNFLLISLGALFLGLIAFLLIPKAPLDKSSIVLGASLPLSGINSNLGHDVVVGANTYFSHTNAKGGIEGRKIEFIQYDDKYEPENTLTNTQTLIEKDNVFALFGFVGTPTVKKILPIITQSNIPFIAPYTGASFLRNADTPNIINFRSSYVEEIEAIVEYLSQTKGITKFAIFYQNDDYGEEGYVALSASLKSRNLELKSEGTYKRNTLSIQHAIHEIRSAKPEAIILVGAYKPTARFITKVKECCLEGVIFAPISFVNANALMEELHGNGENIIFSQTVPSYDDFLSNEAIEYINLLKFYYPKEEPTLVSFESYLASKSVVIALKNIQGTITREKFIASLKSISKHTLDNIPLAYHHSQLLNQVYLSTYSDGKFHIISNKDGSK